MDNEKSIPDNNRKIIYLINPISGTENKNALSRKIEKLTSEAGIPYEILPTKASGNYHHLKNKIAEEKVTDIVICGGDGTINQVAAALQGDDINIGIIPMGSGNGLALAAGIPRGIDKALQVIFKNESAFIDSFYINQRFSCMLCGLGFDAQVALNFSKQKRRGLQTYVIETLRNFFVAKPYPFTLIDRDTKFSSNAYFISIANGNQFGNNVRIAPRASLNDGLLDIVVVNKMSKLKILYSLFRQLRVGQVVPVADKRFHNKDIHYFQSRKLSILNPANAPFHLDGDPCETSEKFEIEVIPNAFRLLQP